ncbi:MAG: hypothetical protein JWR07_5092 [Nevskia sp.]|nr:hypothetical protein [Nevskia sp.]
MKARIRLSTWGGCKTCTFKWNKSGLDTLRELPGFVTRLTKARIGMSTWAGITACAAGITLPLLTFVSALSSPGDSL